LGTRRIVVRFPAVGAYTLIVSDRKDVEISFIQKICMHQGAEENEGDFLMEEGGLQGANFKK
jgi:hypothetical protein